MSKDVSAENIEVRCLASAELRVAEPEGGKPAVIQGYAAVYNELSLPLGSGNSRFREMIAPGAFDKSLSENRDVRALVDHDSGRILGRSKSGTLRMRSTERGLYVEIDPPDTQAGRDIVQSIRRGDVDAMSFAFTLPPAGEEWRMGDGGMAIRTVKEAGLVDVSPVTYAAYPQTSVAVRSLELFQQSLNKPAEFDPSELETLKRMIQQGLL